MDLSRNSLEEIWTSRGRRDFLEAMRLGQQHENCQKCWQKENIGIRSKREIANQEWQHHIDDTSNSPLFIDLKWGNVCNLRCRHCNPWTSSRWVNEWFDISGTHTDKKIYLEQFASTNKSYHPDNKEKFQNTFREWFSQCRHLMLYGGEGMYVNDVLDMFQSVVDTGKSQDIDIYINTNGTIYDHQWADLLSKFHRVRIAFSIDGVGESFDYIRYGAQWDNVIDNFFKYQSLPNVETDIVTTIFSINVYNGLEILRDIYLKLDYVPTVNFVYGPLWWDIRILPDHVKDHIWHRNEKLFPECMAEIKDHANQIRFQDRYEQIQRFLKDSTNDAEAKFQQMLHWLRSVDLSRSQRFDQVFVDYNSLLGVYSQDHK